uniref:CHK kinase-like domain-containing protein n=1 Tax=Bracon brevicornis TaxID=1563983 RepID=A0A6V7M1K9_9HYME
MPHTEDTLPVRDLKGLLTQKFGENIEIVETKWKHLTDPGENFGSLILAVDVVIREANSTWRSLNLVIKLPPPSSYLLKLFNSPETFSKELIFYRDVSPIFLEVQRANGLTNGDASWLAANYYGGRLGLVDHIFDNQACIALENLNYSGYRMADRLVGLTRNQTEYAVKQLSKLHAITIATRLQKPKLFESVVIPALENAANEIAEQCIMDMINKALTDLENIPDAKEDMGCVYRTINATQQLYESIEPDENWLTFVHSDFWGNNMMFRFNGANDQDIVDMKIVDFQLGNYDYGVKDLIFFLISSPRIDLTEVIFDDMVHLYYDEFINWLKKLNVDTANYKKAKFMELLEACGPVKFAQCIAMTQVIKSIPGSAPKMETIENKESFLQIGGGQAYRDKLLQVLTIFKKRRWLVNT